MFWSYVCKSSQGSTGWKGLGGSPAYHRRPVGNILGFLVVAAAVRSLVGDKAVWPPMGPSGVVPRRPLPNHDCVRARLGGCRGEGGGEGGKRKGGVTTDGLLVCSLRVKPQGGGGGVPARPVLDLGREEKMGRRVWRRPLRAEKRDGALFFVAEPVQHIWQAARAVRELTCHQVIYKEEGSFSCAGGSVVWEVAGDAGETGAERRGETRGNPDDGEVTRLAHVQRGRLSVACWGGGRRPIYVRGWL